MKNDLRMFVFNFINLNLGILRFIYKRDLKKN